MIEYKTETYIVTPENCSSNAVIYVHGKGGTAAEGEHYKPLFPDRDVIGLEYITSTPWETGEEIFNAVAKLKTTYNNIILIANSIGAFFSMCAGIDLMIEKAYFISPVVDMEKLITDMMKQANVTEEELENRRVIPVASGEVLSWEYLRWIRNHPLKWDTPTEILYGSRDIITSCNTVRVFANNHNAGLTVMGNGEHWFHTDEQMQFLNDWIKSKEAFQKGDRM